MENKQWKLKDSKGFDHLELNTVKVKEPEDDYVLVKHHAASLNYRDLVIANGNYLVATVPLVPGSDGAGEVVKVGPKVTKYKVGDRVSGAFSQRHDFGPMTPEKAREQLGGTTDGVLQQYRAYPESSLLRIPEYMSYEQAATLPCAGLTAYNALFGLVSRQLKPGQWVLTQGTGGVSVFALQFAKAVGARVIATTSTKEREEVLKKLGADFVLNYKDDKEWGKTAKEITKGRGVDHVVEVGGPGTMAQSLEAITAEGVISVIGFVGKGKDEPTVSSTLRYGCIVRAVRVGPHVLNEEMNRGLEVTKIQPVIGKVFPFEQLKEAYQYQWDQKHIGKVVIQI